jgi:hypothetical protein
LCIDLTITAIYPFCLIGRNVKGQEMRLKMKAALAVSSFCLVSVPAIAVAASPPDNKGIQTAAASQYKPGTPGPGASLPAKAKAYGVYCRWASKTHVTGTPGTQFSKCVTDMAKLATGVTSSPKTACANLSKARVAGQKGTPFSLCVAAGAKLLKANP